MKREVIAATLAGALIGGGAASVVAWQLHAKQMTEAERLQKIIDIDRDASVHRDNQLGDYTAELRRRVDVLERR